MKNIKVTITCVVLALALFVQGASALATQAEVHQPLTLHFLLQTTEDDAAARTFQKIADMYKAEVNPDFVYKPEYISDSDSYYQKLKILIASDEMPDWFLGDPDTFIAELRAKNLIFNVGDMLEELKLTDKFLGITLNYPRLSDGELYGMAWGANCEWFWYHPSMFEAVGASVPTTWAEFFDVCEKLKANNMTPIAGPPRMSMVLRAAAFIPFRMQGNAWIHDAISGKISWGSEPGIAMGEFMQKYATYFNNGWSGMDSSSMRDFFLSKGAAMWYESTGQCLQYVTDEKHELVEDVSYFKLPLLDGYDATDENMFFANSGKAIFMSEAFAQANKAELYQYMDFLVKHFGDVFMYDYNTMSGIKPSDEAALSDFHKQLYTEFNKVEEYASCWDVVIDSVSNEVLKAEIYNLTLGEITPQEFADIMDQTIAENVKK